MKFAALRCAAIGLALALAGCVAIDHNIPTDPINPAAPERLTVYADSNGHLYPDDWDPPFQRERIERRHSLLASAGFDPAVHRALRETRERQLDAIAARLAGRTRIFILVHGFNNNQADARQGFDAVREKLALRETDGVVEFHWDGLWSTSMAGQARMWFYAAGYSQLAGTQALRGLLRRLADREVIVIAHSRGSSVTLSALSDPAYDPRFRRGSDFLVRAGDFDSAPLPEGRGGTIDVLLLAPAIGNPDFRRPGATGNDCGRDFRAFPAALRSIHYSVNPLDPVLRKIFSPLRSRFNATDFGYDAAVGRRVAGCYDGRVRMVGYAIRDPDMATHPFVDYARHRVFLECLRRSARGPDAALGRAPRAESRSAQGRLSPIPARPARNRFGEGPR